MFWLGFRINGILSLDDNSKLNYWVDFATVKGSERDFNTTDISPTEKVISSIQEIDISNGYAIDFGTAWKSSSDLWRVTFNYAAGSGDSSEADEQSSFRQSVITNNKGRIPGNNRYRIYGEFLQPELSNLQLFSVSAGRKLNQNIWLHGIYYHYRQLQADTQLQASSLSISPNGKDKEIGSEIDVLLSASWNKNFNALLTLSGFHAGAAFDRVATSKSAYKAVMEINYIW